MVFCYKRPVLLLHHLFVWCMFDMWYVIFIFILMSRLLPINSNDKHFKMGSNGPINVYFPPPLCCSKNKKRAAQICNFKMSEKCKNDHVKRGHQKQPSFLLLPKNNTDHFEIIVWIYSPQCFDVIFWFIYLFVSALYYENPISHFIVKEKNKHILYPKILCLFRVV